MIRPIIIDRCITRPRWLLACLLLLCGFDQTTSQLLSHKGETMGTTFTVKWQPSDRLFGKNLPPLIDQVLATIDHSMSTYKKDSELSRLNHQPAGEAITISKDLTAVLKLALKMSEQTNGAFDVTIGPLVDLWGFGPSKPVTPIPADTSIQQVLNKIGYQHIHLDEAKRSLRKTVDVTIDLSAIAKGYAVDVLADLLKSNGITDYLVEIGGDLRVSGKNPEHDQWRIGIDNPENNKRSFQAKINLTDTSVATSGDYRNYFEHKGIRYSHTINPTSGKPIRHPLASVTVLMPTCATADALATALMVMGPVEGRQFAVDHGIEAFFIVRTKNSFDTFWTP